MGLFRRRTKAEERENRLQGNPGSAEYLRWREQRGLDPAPSNLSPRDQARFYLRQLDAELERLDRMIRVRRGQAEATGRGFAALARLEEEYQRLDGFHDRFWPIAHPAYIVGAERHGLRCKEPGCGGELRSRKEAFRTGNRCEECWAVATGAAKRPDPLEPRDAEEAALAAALERLGGE